MIEIVDLLSLGVPWDVALGMSPARRLAIMVIAGERKGGKFNWKRMKWEERDA